MVGSLVARLAQDARFQIRPSPVSKWYVVVKRKLCINQTGHALYSFRQLSKTREWPARVLRFPLPKKKCRPVLVKTSESIQA